MMKDDETIDESSDMEDYPHSAAENVAAASGLAAFIAAINF